MPRLTLQISALLSARGWSAIELHRRSRGRISLSTAHRLNRGAVKAVSLALLGVLCDVLGCEPGDLFTRG